MQNQPEKPSNSLKKFLREKGYYIVLALCVAAVGVSGYLFVRTASDQGPAISDPSLSVPLTVPNETTGSKGSGDKSESTSTPSSTVGQEAAEDAAGSAELTEDTAETAVSATVRPHGGDTIAVFSVDALAYNETTQDWRTHEGVDIAADLGIQVKAAAGGTVTAIEQDYFMGTTVTIDHGNDMVSVYSNLAEQPTVEVGDVVTTGDIIGSVGSTAKAESLAASHLHLEMMKDGAYVDPLEYLPDVK